jgi:trans-aconitate methyltransferase
MNERPIEYSFVFKCLAITGVKTVLDVGTGRTALPSLIKNCDINVQAIDNDLNQIKNNKYWDVMYDDIFNSKLKDKFDLVTCVSVLEHIKDHNKVVKEMVNKLNPKSYLILTFPYNENNYIENNYKLPDAGYGKNSGLLCQSFSKKEINKWCLDNNLKLLEQEYWEVFNGKYWTVGGWKNKYTKVNRMDKHQLSCNLFLKNN